MEKQCTKCGEWYPKTSEYFNYTNKKKGYMRADCKSCIKKYNRKYYREHDEQIKIATKEYREENKETLSEKKKEYYMSKREYFISLNRKHYSENKDRYRKWANDWIINNKERYKEVSVKHSQQRRARINELENDFDEKMWEECKQHFGFKCAYCGEYENLEQEHFIPLKQDGGYIKSNIIPACKSCNSSKNDNNFFEWYPRQNCYSKERERYILDYLKYNNKIQQLSIL